MKRKLGVQKVNHHNIGTVKSTSITWCQKSITKLELAISHLTPLMLLPQNPPKQHFTSIAPSPRASQNYQRAYCNNATSMSPNNSPKGLPTIPRWNTKNAKPTTYLIYQSAYTPSLSELLFRFPSSGLV